MPAASSILGRCPDCCDCPAPVLRWDSRSAIVEKDGWYYPEAPDTKYLAMDIVGATRGVGVNIVDINFTDGPNTIDPVSLVQTANLVMNRVGYDFFSECDALIGGTSSSVSAGTFSLYRPHSYNPPGISSYCPGFGPLEVVLSNPYTEEILRSTAEAKLPAWDGDWNDTAGSYRSLSADGSTLAIRDARYEWRLPRHRVGSGRCHGIRWVVRFTPADGGPVVDTPHCASWSGDTPEDYDPDDVSTWAVMPNGEEPFFSLPPSAANGSTSIVEIEWSCRCKEAACP